jgi:hypothetical protein
LARERRKYFSFEFRQHSVSNFGSLTAGLAEVVNVGAYFGRLKNIESELEITNGIMLGRKQAIEWDLPLGICIS